MKKKKKKLVSGSVTLSIGGKPLKIDMTASAAPVTARRMLPVMQRITNTFVEFGVARETEKGKEISCKAGCGACCRQPVPIAESEAYALAEYVESLPESEKTEVKNRFEAAVKELSETAWFARLEALPKDASEERQKIAMEYFGHQIPCPFLIEESCSIHKIRPLACREYLVTSPAVNCSDPKPDSIKMVSLPAIPSYIFRKLTKKDPKDTKDSYLPLISALDFVKNKPESEIKYKGDIWLANFFKTLAESRPKKHTGNDV